MYHIYITYIRIFFAYMIHVISNLNSHKLLVLVIWPRPWSKVSQKCFIIASAQLQVEPKAHQHISSLGHTWRPEKVLFEQFLLRTEFLHILSNSSLILINPESDKIVGFQCRRCSTTVRKIWRRTFASTSIERWSIGCDDKLKHESLRWVVCLN